MTDGENTTEDIEVELVLEALFLQYGYDFRNYARSSLKRRMFNFVASSRLKCIADIIPLILHSKKKFEELVLSFSVNVTEMFRDPFVFKMIREKIIPYLNTYPEIKIWHPGCATGEEVYSMAILLEEENLYDKTMIYATDINKQAIERAKSGIYSLEQVQTNTKNYQKSGGKNSFSSYYYSKFNSSIIKKELRKNILFSTHNLVTDTMFNTFQLIMCRNVLIYFNKNLQNQVFNLFDSSLIKYGFLCIGTKESLMFSDLAEKYEEIGKNEKIYRKRTDE